MKPVDSTKIMQILCISRLQRPILAPLQMKNLQHIEFQLIPAFTHS